MIESELRDADADDSTRDPRHAISGGGPGESGIAARAHAGAQTVHGYAENEVPQPQVDLAFGFWKLNPVPFSPSEKSSVIPLRNR